TVTVTQAGNTGSQTVTGSNTSAIAIPDNNTTGVTRVINIATALTIQSVSATVNITHPYRGDVQIELISPAGTVATLKTTSNDSGDNINATYTPTSFNGQNSAGNWTLRVKDLFASDIGTLNSWSISITGTTGGGTCTYSVSPTSVSATAAGGASSVSVTAGTGCAWTATSNASWITTSASGSGNGTASFTVAANSGTTSRTGTLTVAGQTVTVTQAGNSGSQTVTGSNTSPIAIPDNNTTGVTRVINIATALTIQSVSVSVNITHTWRGDIQIELISPAGTTTVLKATSSSDSADNIVATYTPTTFTGQNSAGNWTLRVKDLASSDTGTLNNWSISITGTTSGAKASNDQASGVNPAQPWRREDSTPLSVNRKGYSSPAILGYNGSK
ncbi:MAG: proprotein convertase P-domain-containing protein, partial [Acidobacteria bacterium]|nr:proprotein convertase P-domain-containing protein [Acidobacteriota bacterium]